MMQDAVEMLSEARAGGQFVVVATDHARVGVAWDSLGIDPGRIASVLWHNKAAGVPQKVRLKNGWTIRFYSSSGDPMVSIVGLDIDGACLFGAMQNPGWEDEIEIRRRREVPA